MELAQLNIGLSQLDMVAVQRDIVVARMDMGLAHQQWGMVWVLDTEQVALHREELAHKQVVDLDRLLYNTQSR